MAARDLPKHGSEMGEQREFSGELESGQLGCKAERDQPEFRKQVTCCGIQADLRNLTTAQILTPHLRSAE